LRNGFLDLDDLAPQNFTLRDRHLLLTRFAWLRPTQQLTRPRAGNHDELEPVFFWCALHE
jgi:hypothetical protein